MSDIVVPVSGISGAASGSVGPCEPWATTADLCSPCDDYAMDATLLEDSIDVASEVLYMLSGRQFSGLCSETVRPTCDCGGRRNIKLRFPIVEVTEVKVDGDVLSSDYYRVDDQMYLRRLPDANGNNPGWPCGQDLDLETTEDDTFEVTYTYGVEPPLSGVKAAAVLACEIALACQPETAGQCRLPSSVVSTSRQGVTTTRVPLITAIEGGQVGIKEVDWFLMSVNPQKARRRSRVYSPDLDQRNRHVGT